MTLAKKLTLTLCALSLSACAANPVRMVTPLNEQDRGIRNVQSVNVKYSELNIEGLEGFDQKNKELGEKVGKPEEPRYQPLKDTLKITVKDHLEGRDSNGNLHADIEIEVDNFELINPATVMLIGDMDMLTGSVRAYDPKSKELLTEFHIHNMKIVTGLLDLALRGEGDEARNKMSQEFAEHIGDELGFPKTEDKDKSKEIEETKETITGDK